MFLLGFGLGYCRVGHDWSDLAATAAAAGTLNVIGLSFSKWEYSSLFIKEKKTKL